MAQARPTSVPDDGLTTRERRHRPVVLVNTGDGKGKTTAAMGVAMRGWHQGWSIGVYQFIKSGKWQVGEAAALRALGRLHDTTGEGGPVTWETMGTGWTWTPAAEAVTDPAEAARQGWSQVKSLLAVQAHRLYILDEFTYPLDRGWVDLADVVATLAARPGKQHVVITGRRAPRALKEAADLVTDMTCIKHPFDSGQKGQAGIEW